VGFIGLRNCRGAPHEGRDVEVLAVDDGGLALFERPRGRARIASCPPGRLLTRAFCTAVGAGAGTGARRAFCIGAEKRTHAGGGRGAGNGSRRWAGAGRPGRRGGADSSFCSASASTSSSSSSTSSYSPAPSASTSLVSLRRTQRRRPGSGMPASSVVPLPRILQRVRVGGHFTLGSRGSSGRKLLRVRAPESAPPAADTSGETRARLAAHDAQRRGRAELGHLDDFHVGGGQEGGTRRFSPRAGSIARPQKTFAPRSWRRTSAMAI